MSAAQLGAIARNSAQFRNDWRNSLTAHPSPPQVRNSDVYIIQPSSPPVNDNLMELLLCASAVRRAAAARVTAVVPYYGYARQDRKERSRVPISAADVAKMMEAMGVDRVCCVDLHCGQIQGFFGPRTPVDNLFATPIALGYFQTRELVNCAIVSPDAGGVARAKMFKEGLEARRAIRRAIRRNFRRAIRRNLI